MICFQLLSYAYSDDTTSPRPLCTVSCDYVRILGTQALRCSLHRVTRVEFCRFCGNFPKSVGVAWSCLTCHGAVVGSETYAFECVACICL